MGAMLKWGRVAFCHGPRRAGSRGHRAALARLARPLGLGLVALVLGLGACDRGDLGDEPVKRCVPEGACDEAMFQGGIKASLGDATRGAKLYADNCARCHGPAGRGEGDAKAIDMTSPAWQASLRDAAIVKNVRSGRGTRMPAFTFGDQQLRDILAHVRRLEVRAAPAPGGGYGGPMMPAGEP